MDDHHRKPVDESLAARLRGALVLTGAGDLVRADTFERGRKIAGHLRVQAERLDDSFGEIAALLFELATWQALQLEGVHALARSLDAHAHVGIPHFDNDGKTIDGGSAGGAPNVLRAVDDMVADARRLFAAAAVFRALAEHEDDMRMLFDLEADKPVNANAVESGVKAAS